MISNKLGFFMSENSRLFHGLCRFYGKTAPNLTTWNGFPKIRCITQHHKGNNFSRILKRDSVGTPGNRPILVNHLVTGCRCYSVANTGIARCLHGGTSTNFPNSHEFVGLVLVIHLQHGVPWIDGCRGLVGWPQRPVPNPQNPGVPNCLEPGVPNPWCPLIPWPIQVFPIREGPCPIFGFPTIQPGVFPSLFPR